MESIDFGGLLLFALVYWFADRTPGAQAPTQPRPRLRDLFSRSPRTEP